MSYSKFLDEKIKEKGYSQSQIAQIAKNKYNKDIDASYISMLKSGKKIASKEVNEVIAKVCGIDPEDLQFEADMERAPESVKKTIDELINALIKIFTMQNEMFDMDAQSLEKVLRNMPKRQFMELVAQSDFFEDISKENFNKEIESGIAKNVFMELSTSYKMEDGSMLPVIQEGAKLLLDNTTEIKNGDIVLAKDKENNTLIRFYNEEGDIITLIPMNSKFEVNKYKKDEIKINSIVKGYITSF